MRAIVNLVCKNANGQLCAVPQEMHGAKWRPSRAHVVERKKKGRRP